VAGLTRTGSRQEFAVVTGVSVGATSRPLRISWTRVGRRLLEVSPVGGRKLAAITRLGVISAPAVSRKALRQLVDAYLSDTMIQAIRARGGPKAAYCCGDDGL